MLPRARGARPTWPVDLAEPVAGNYYPITSSAALLGGRLTEQKAPAAAAAVAAEAALEQAGTEGIARPRRQAGGPGEDKVLALTLATDRAQGAASLSDGELEVMRHR